MSRLSHSGLVVAPDYRGRGLAKELKHRLFASSRDALPAARLMSITVAPAVKALNLALGFRPARPT